MPMMSNNDNYISKPKFPKERTEKGLVTLSLANTCTFPNAIIRVVTAGNVANGWVANATNIGNTFGLQGWNQIGPSVVNVSGNTIFLSQAPGNTLAVGSLITFSKPLSLTTSNTVKANLTSNTYNANTYAVSITRLTNANSIVAHVIGQGNTKTSAIAHQGWVLVIPQTGYVKTVTPLLPGLGYANGYITISANTQYPGGSGANVAYTVNANGAIISCKVNANGGNYVLTPAATVPQVNGANHFYISTIAVTTPGANYVNGFFTITANDGFGAGANASYNTYSANGGINTNSIVLNFTGGGYSGNNQNVFIQGANGTNVVATVTEVPGTNATFTIIMGGRANRFLTEVLAVANTMGITDQNSGGLWFPGS